MRANTSQSLKGRATTKFTETALPDVLVSVWATIPKPVSGEFYLRWPKPTRTSSIFAAQSFISIFFWKAPSTSWTIPNAPATTGMMTGHEVYIDRVPGLNGNPTGRVHWSSPSSPISWRRSALGEGRQTS